MEDLRDTWRNDPEGLVEEELLSLRDEDRADLLRYSVDITLDRNTAHSHLLLLEENREVKVKTEDQRHPEHPDRFKSWCCYQVLSRESLTGRCYWEVERRARGGVRVAVAYRSIRRDDKESGEIQFGSSDKSWALVCYPEGYEFIHNRIRTPVSGPASSRLGVFLDHSAGILSFYSVFPTWTLLHTVYTSFSQPLHAGITLYYFGDSAEIVRDESSSPAVPETVHQTEIPRETRTNIPERRNKEELSLSTAEPESRAEMLRHSVIITLERNTANRRLRLSEENRKVTFMEEDECYSDHPDRFTEWCPQVLSRESLTGRCYWEVERRGRGKVTIAVSYQNISRDWQTVDCYFGYDNKSWALDCDNDIYAFIHNGTRTPVSGPAASRLGVFLDHSAGILSFYSVSPTWTLLHRVFTSFSQPLHVGFGLFRSVRSSAEIVRV